MNISVLNNDNPFDSIRHFDSQGNEFWNARELMPLLEYKQWRRFNDAIERAKITCQNSGNVVNSHFANVDQMQQIGGSQAQRLVTIDVKLTRYACYLIAMNGDPRKEAIAQAQTYFAVKTREAEVIIPQQNEKLEEMRLQIELLKMEKEVAIANAQLSIAQKNLIDTRHFITTALPELQQQMILGVQIVEKVIVDKQVYKENEFIRNDSTINKTQLCQRYKVLTKNGKPDYAKMNKILSDAGLPKEAWYEVKDIRTNTELKKEYLNYLDKLIYDDCRQLWIGE